MTLKGRAVVRWCWVGFFAVSILAGAKDVHAARRVALLVAHPQGGDGLIPLRYARNDLERMREVLENLGRFAPEDVLTSFGDDAAQVRERFEAAYAKLHAPDDIFVFYYSGHAKDGALRLGETRIELVELRRLMAASGADLNIAMLDSCRSGEMTRLKGASVGPPLAVRVDETVTQNGTVVITASSDTENAQESDAIQGSFFTHYLASGLRGAADDNDDGDVTLSEAYGYAYALTVARTIGTRGGVQHPSYRFDLHGAGQVVLTRLNDRASAVVFPAPLAGSFLVFDKDRRVVIAELDKSAGDAARIAVAPGRYIIKKRESDHLRMTQVTVRSKGEARVDVDLMKRVDFDDDYAKGATVKIEDIARGPTEMRLSLGLLGQSFLSSPVRNEVLPDVALLSLTWDIDNLLRRNIGIAFDLAFGGADPETLIIEDDFLGELQYDTQIGQVSAGAALTARVPLRSESLSLHGTMRLGWILITREFDDGTAPDQILSTFTPGIGGAFRWRVIDWLSLGVLVRLHYMFFNVDDTRSLTAIDGGAFFSVHL
ncbi:MAG: caspase family protein [Myxococcota bacterium]